MGCEQYGRQLSCDLSAGASHGPDSKVRFLGIANPTCAEWPLRSRRTPLMRKGRRSSPSEHPVGRSAPPALTELLARLKSSDQNTDPPLTSVSADLKAAQTVIGSMTVDFEDEDSTSGTLPLEKVNDLIFRLSDRCLLFLPHRSSRS